MIKCRSERISPFLKKTHAILENPEFRDVIRWHDKGDMFFIADPNRLVLELLPRFFKHNKLESFIRQLNIYGFKKVRKGIAQNSFCHPEFRRGNTQSLFQIHRGSSNSKEICPELKDHDQSNMTDMTSTTTLTKHKDKEKDVRERELDRYEQETLIPGFKEQLVDMSFGEQFSYYFPEWAVADLEPEPSISI